MEAPSRIVQLIEHFDRNYDHYKSNQYNETQLRREFLDPFFIALGWDVNNESGTFDAYKDVIHEDAIKIGGFTKAPDYCFRVGGNRKFFVEAKKPAVNIKDDATPAYQLRRYAWSAKLPLSILSDFEELAVYDCRIKPNLTDKASIARTIFFNYKDYLTQWDKIASIFSKDAVWKGELDKYADINKLKKGTTEVDDAFLDEIENWRDILARNLALRNESLTQRQLNEIVQKTIDRIVFLRICEDRNIEKYGRLINLLNGANIYPRLCQMFQEADAKYNSGLFHFENEKEQNSPPDELSLNLNIDDKVLKEIIKKLYYPDSPYEFSVLPADILGQVYEQFLGKVIRLTAGHQAKVEEKPEVKKAGGVYYTPTYIVDYIVNNTVGKLLEGKTPKEVSELKILDPACGSGSFLIVAYQKLLDWHLKWYLDNIVQKIKSGSSPSSKAIQDLIPNPLETAQSKKRKNSERYLPIIELGPNDWRLTMAERKRILLNNVFGVDIDSQAVEVTKLSLLLKVLENENEQTLSPQLKLFQDRALPDLGNNIKCGNSLIGSDYYSASCLFANYETRLNVNPFDWNLEFSDIVRQGGFDVAIGNPPYGYMIPDDQQEYFARSYKYQDYQKDLYLLFLERYHQVIKQKGLLGIIVSNTWLQSVTLRNIRKYMTSQYTWLNILHLPEKVFRAVVDTHVLIFQKGTQNDIPQIDIPVFIRKDRQISKSHDLRWENVPCDGDPINIISSSEKQEFFRRIMTTNIPLKDVCFVYNGVKPFEKGKGNPPQTDQVMKDKPFVREGSQPDETWSPLLRGSLINRYKVLWNNNYWIKYGNWLAAPRDPCIFEAAKKIMVRQTGDSIIAVIVGKGFIARNNLHILLPKNADQDLRYILGIMNSKFIDFIYTCMNPEKGEALAEVKKHHVECLPIHSIRISNKLDGMRSDRLCTLVEEITDLHSKHLVPSSNSEKTLIQRQLDATNHMIDQLVYELYGLTDEEIKIVEETCGK